MDNDFVQGDEKYEQDFLYEVKSNTLSNYRKFS